MALGSGMTAAQHNHRLSSAAFPTPGGLNITINSGAIRDLVPGSYRSVIVNSGGTLRLGAGSYFFQGLTINMGATARVLAGTRVLVAGTFAYRSRFTAAGGAPQAIFLGLAGSGSVALEAPFAGTVVAPLAHVTFGSGSGLTYTGSFFARVVEVRPGSKLACAPGPSGPP